MTIDNFGVIELNEDDGIKLLYSNMFSHECLFNKITAEQFNNSIDINQDNFELLKKYIKLIISQKEFDQRNQKTWFMPENYCPTLIEDLYKKCENNIQVERVTVELELYHKHNMIDLLFFLKYLVDIMKKNNIVWGVGRGSSVASYVLFLIGVHKIDSIKYDIPITEFFKQN